VGGSAQLLWQGPAQLKVGDTFALQLVMQADQPVVSVPLAIGFDPRLLQVADVSEGGFLRQGGAQTSFSFRVDPAGQVLMTATRSGSGGASAADAIATIEFPRAGGWRRARRADHHCPGRGGRGDDQRRRCRQRTP
jgi:general secretion pathway protein D